MNKNDFLKQLEKELSVLGKEERREIIEFYEERFHTGMEYEDRTEEEILAELESPRRIARNVLEEYGVTKRYVKEKEERYSNISGFQVIMLVLYDVFVVSWLIPALFGVAVGLFGSLISYITVPSLLSGTITMNDAYMFAFITSIFVLVFIFAFVVLEALFFVFKKTVIWHLNVFKIRKRENHIRTLSKLSVDRWFKRHKFFRFVKNLALVAALVTVVYTGRWIWVNQDQVLAHYEYNEVETDSYELDVTNDIENNQIWSINTEMDYLNLEIVPSSDNSIHIYHTYVDDDDEFLVEISDADNQITVYQEKDTEWLHWTWRLTDIIQLVQQDEQIRIEVPQDLLLDTVLVDTASGEVDIENLEMSNLNISLTNGAVELQFLTIENDAIIHTTNGTISIADSELLNLGRITTQTTNGRISIKRVEVGNIIAKNTNGNIVLVDINVENQDAQSIDCDTTNGNINLENVYAPNVDLDTTNGNINFHNDDLSFIVTDLDTHTTNGQVSTNVD